MNSYVPFQNASQHALYSVKPNVKHSVKLANAFRMVSSILSVKRTILGLMVVSLVGALEGNRKVSRVDVGLKLLIKTVRHIGKNITNSCLLCMQ